MLFATINNFLVLRVGNFLIDIIMNKTFFLLLSVLSIVMPVCANKAKGLPCILIEGTPCNEYVKCKYSFVSNGKDTIRFDAMIKWRGNTAKHFEKKSYSIKIVDDKGKGKDVSFLGMRTDNKWILDAMAVDKSRMRNRVSFDLWNDFSHKSYIMAHNNKTVNGTRGHFVEVYLNGEYNGIYCLTEKIDRKQLKLAKHNKGRANGLLYKAESFLYTGFWEVGDYDNTKMTWGGWEMKYPDLSKGETIDWQPLYDATDFVVNATEDEFDAKVAEYFDLPVWSDYFLFANVIMAFDNHAKNNFTYVYDKTKSQKLGFAPWDLDATWGRNHKGNPLSADKEIYYNKLFARLLESKKINFMRAVASRYFDLRKTVLSETRIKERFNSYFQLFRETGAAQRETEKWNGVDDVELDFDQEELYINNWIEQRLDYLDETWKQALTSIENVETVRERVGDNNIYTPWGVKANKENLSPGLYIMKNKKVIIRY